MTITKPAKTYSFVATTVAKSSEVNTNFDNAFNMYGTSGYLYDGWFALDGASLEYHATDAVKTTADVNLTNDLQVGDRVTFEQSSTEKFYTIININYNSTVANRTYIQLTGNTVANSAITAGTVGFSRHIRPYKFPAVPFFGNETSGIINGKIAVSVASNNLTVAIKTLADTDPSASNPVGVYINGALRLITSALSVTANAGTNWFGSGNTLLENKEIDYFVYLAWNAGGSIVMLGFGRVPYARVYGDFTGWASSTNPRYCHLVNTTSSALTDNFVNVGRFAATLSGAGTHNWSVPSVTTNTIVQRPIFNTRWLSYTPNIVEWANAPTSTTRTGIYQINMEIASVHCQITGTQNANNSGQAVRTGLPINPLYPSGYGAGGKSPALVMGQWTDDASFDDIAILQQNVYAPGDNILTQFSNNTRRPVNYMMSAQYPIR